MSRPHRPWFDSLRSRLIGALAAQTLVVTLALLLPAGVVLVRQWESYLDRTVTVRAGTLAELAGRLHDQEGGWTPPVLARLEALAAAEGLQLAVRTPGGTLLWQSASPAMPAMHHAPGPMPGHMMGRLASRRALPVAVADREVGILEVTVPPWGGLLLAEAAGFSRALLARVRWGLLAAAAVAVLMALLLARQISRPLGQMTGVAQAMERGDWSQRLPVAGPRELRALAGALNSLAAGLEQHESSRRRLMRDVAHDLRTPLTLLRGQLEAYQDGVWQPTPERQAAFHGEVMRLVRLVDDLDRMAEAESGALHLNREPLAAGALARTLGEAFGPGFAARGIAFAVDDQAGGAQVLADPDRIRQVLVNLLANALQFAPSGTGRVQLTTAAGEGEVRFAVSDNGPGIDPEHLSRIFDRFYRADPARGRGGSGLGLAIARTLAEAHGGRILVASRPGAGSTFTLVLPRHRR